MNLLRGATCALALAMLAGCGTEPDDILGVEGAWSLEFDARSTEACPREEQATCAGVGSVDFQASGDMLAPNGTGRGSCDTCSLALDFTFSAMTAAADGSQLAMQVSSCRLTGPLPQEGAMTAQGETLCQLPGTPAVQARGTWRVTRLTR